MTAALVKMRMPSTTSTAVDNCEPTPIRSPIHTISAAIATFEMNETAKTLSEKVFPDLPGGSNPEASRAANDHDVEDTAATRSACPAAR